MKTLGTILREAREATGYSQHGLAKETAINQGTLSRMEKDMIIGPAIGAPQTQKLIKLLELDEPAYRDARHLTHLLTIARDHNRDAMQELAARYIFTVMPNAQINDVALMMQGSLAEWAKAAEAPPGDEEAAKARATRVGDMILVAMILAAMEGNSGLDLAFQAMKFRIGSLYEIEEPEPEISPGEIPTPTPGLNFEYPRRIPEGV